LTARELEPYHVYERTEKDLKMRLPSGSLAELRLYFFLRLWTKLRRLPHPPRNEAPSSMGWIGLCKAPIIAA
jgi:hypothetical protein